MEDLTYSRKSFQGTKPLNNFERKQRTEAKNIEASKAIIAAKALKKKNEDVFYNSKSMVKEREAIKNNEVSNDDIVKILDKQIKEMDRRIEIFERKAEEGQLRKGEELRMKEYVGNRDKLIAERKGYVKGGKSITNIAIETQKATEVNNEKVAV